MACKVCGKNKDTRAGVCWDCAHKAAKKAAHKRRIQKQSRKVNRKK